MDQVNLTDMDQRDLAFKIKQGNQLAFAIIYDRYHKNLYALAYRYLKSRSMAEDAVQQVFVNFWIHRDKIDKDGNIKSLLFTSLKNHTLNTLRNYQSSIEKNYEMLLTSETYETSDDELESTEMTALIEKAFETLSPQRKQIYYLKIIEGLSNLEIATKLNISINTVKFQYSQILIEFRAFVNKNMIPSLIVFTTIFR